MCCVRLPGMRFAYGALRANLRVIAGLDPAIHLLRKKFLRRGWTRGSSPRVTGQPAGRNKRPYAGGDNE
jgi:hypothetical protein